MSRPRGSIARTQRQRTMPGQALKLATQGTRVSPLARDHMRQLTPTHRPQYRLRCSHPIPRILRLAPRNTATRPQLRQTRMSAIAGVNRGLHHPATAFSISWQRIEGGKRMRTPRSSPLSAVPFPHRAMTAHPISVTISYLYRRGSFSRPQPRRCPYPRRHRTSRVHKTVQRRTV